MARSIGCLDCGRVWQKKSDVPRQCQPYVEYVKKNVRCFGGYEATGDEPPRFD